MQPAADRHARAAADRGLMMQRTVYIVAYDVSSHPRRDRVRRCLKAYRVGGQKSVPEVWVTPAELQQLRASLDALIAPAEDRLHLVALDPRSLPRSLGQAQTFQPGSFVVL